jgi:cobalt-zinc-cadmium efflux system membrane fusion protein
MKKNKSAINLMLLLVMYSLVACHIAEEPTENHEAEESSSPEEEEIVLSTEQMSVAAIQIGSFSYRDIGEHIEANGVIELPPNNIASISPYMEGFIQKINFLEGATARKGDVLVELKNPDFVRLQQDYIQAYSRLDYLKQELQRQQRLNEAEVGAKKDLQQVQSEHRGLSANLSAIKEQLAFLGVHPDSVAAGNIRNTVYLKAPFDGTVTSVSAHLGELVKAGQEIMELINREHMHLELQVFQKNIPAVRAGQKIIFSIPAFENGEVHHGVVSLVGKNLNPDTKTIRVHGHFDEDPLLIPGLYVEAQIIRPAARSRVLPEGAIVRDGGKHYFFIKKEQRNDLITFDKVAFEPGITSEGFVQLKHFQTDKDTTAIVIDGAFYLKSEMNKTEESED